jgi:hypothetical protein
VHILRKTPPAKSPHANKHQRLDVLAFLMRKSELVRALEGKVEGDLEHLRRRDLAELCAATMPDQVEMLVFAALRARSL